MNLKQLLFSAFCSFELATAFAQECPPLPEAFPYHDPKKHFHQYDLPTYQLIELSKTETRHKLERYFNRTLKKIQQFPCSPNTDLQEKVFLFQTHEYKGDSLKLKTSIEDQFNTARSVDPGSACFVYGHLFQRDLSENDSVKISTWYIKQFTGNELKDVIRERNYYAAITDSLNQELAKIKAVQNRDWRQTDALIEPLRERRTLFLQIRDSLDFMLYPTLREELKPWYSQFNAEVLTNPESHQFSTTRRNLSSDQDVFLQKTFRLHHGFINDPYYGEFITPGDSIIRKGTDLYNSPVVADDYSPWRDPHLSFASLGDKYLVVFKTESNIGETYWDLKHSYFIYEVHN